MIGLDTETTGLDFFHGTKPFIVTIYDSETDENLCWQWDVDPFTREPEISESDIDEIEEYCNRDDRFVLQNTKFDVKALWSIRPSIEQNWQWDKTEDTLIAGHLLGSNEPKDLGTLAVKFCGRDISLYEDKMNEAVKKARNLCRRKEFIKKHGDWKIAKKGLDEMPSAKDSVWKCDLWLPRAVAKAEGYPEDHPWWNITATYGSVDSWITVRVHQQQLKVLEDKGLTNIYRFRLKLLRIAHRMEMRGVTVNSLELHKKLVEYKAEAIEAGEKCLAIAEKYDYDLTLPKSGNNKSITEFVFGQEKLRCKECNKELDIGKVNKGLSDGFCPDCGGIGVYVRYPNLDLPVVKTSKKTGKPSLDKKVMEFYEITLDKGTDQYEFVTQLSDKRKRDTAISYMESYKRFWLAKPGSRVWRMLYPNLNITGTDTLRMSSNNPNEQNISKKKGFNLRSMFGPAPGREWWSLDCQNIELRIPSYESGERELIDLFEASDKPPYYGSLHLLNFSTVYPDIWDEALKKVGLEKVGAYCKDEYADTWYQWCKNGGFAVQYGAVERVDSMGTADIAFHREGSQARLRQRFSNMDKLNRRCIQYANRYGYVETLPDRTVDPKHGYPLLCSRSKWGGVVETTPLNYHVSGTAMWVMCRMMVDVQNYLDKVNAQHDGDYAMIIQVHDEIVFDFPYVPNKGNRKIIKTIKSIMGRVGGDLIPAIPLPVSVKYHSKNWAEGETYESRTVQVA